MTSLLLSRRDVDFLLHDWLNIGDLARFERFADHGRETADAVLDLAEGLARDYFAPHNKLADQNEPHFVDGRVELIPEVGRALEAFAEAGLFAATADYDLGGMQLPLTISSVVTAYFSAANIGTMAYPFLTIGAANLLKTYGTPQQIEDYARPMLLGRYFGTMCLSEPQAGSSLADITTRAEPDGDGAYRLFGRKMWISAGDHELSENIVHLVLAKAPGGGEGVRGISLFVVPKVLVEGDLAGQRNDVVLAGLNHKMGYRGAVNALLNFGEGAHSPDGRPGAVGYLVGELHNGLAQMFHMMNEARIKVGLGATALGYTGYLHALDYARERPQGRSADAKGATRQVPIIAHADVRRMLLTQKAYVEGALALNLFCANLVDLQAVGEPEERREAQALLDVLTPVAKSWPSQWCLAANDLAIQVHGGYGYTRDYNVEQFYRDNRLNAIHEGTHGIQALDLLGRKTRQNGGGDVRRLWERIDQTLERARSQGGEPAAWADRLAGARAELEAVTLHLQAEVDAELRLANASVYLEAFGHVVVAWIWLEQALACTGKSGDFYDGKRQACRFFMDWELPKVGPQLALLRRMDSATLDMENAWF
ncbi:acyl-CoA dehydrogenase [uncultured Brevundimonas sp.]|uniref:acyl-CoA dehydrogenase n=1 Tax=uncultured Brevundimonas sp. TaxID=213418 RepID=UPI0025E896C9|nr:acyl-CoA dehydrogenase [uncultured Brevundimonas sp.]